MPDQQPTDIETLILRYFNREVGPQEINRLETWVQEDPQHKALFIEMRKVWMLSGMARHREPIDVDTEWNRLAQQTTRVTPMQVVARRATSRMWRIAAAVLFLIAAGTILFLQFGTGDQLFVAGADVRTIKLEDGSTVTLNRGSVLTWHTDRKDRRSLSLKGDAFFDVARDESKPFIIGMGEVEVEVLGTSFYVNAQPDQPTIGVTVENGRVGVRAGFEAVVLSANEKAVVNTTDLGIVKATNDDPNFTSVKTGTLVFDNSPIDIVAATLNRHFHANIRVATQTAQTCALTATFEQNSLDAILQIIASTIGISVTHQNNQITLQGSCTLN